MVAGYFRIDYAACSVKHLFSIGVSVYLHVFDGLHYPVLLSVYSALPRAASVVAPASSIRIAPPCLAAPSPSLHPASLLHAMFTLSRCAVRAAPPHFTAPRRARCTLSRCAVRAAPSRFAAPRRACCLRVPPLGLRSQGAREHTPVAQRVAAERSSVHAQGAHGR